MTAEEKPPETPPAFIIDDKGAYALDHVFAVTAFTVDHNPKTNTSRVIGILHYPGGVVSTNTDYATLRKLVFGK